MGILWWRKERDLVDRALPRSDDEVKIQRLRVMITADVIKAVRQILDNKAKANANTDAAKKGEQQRQ